MNLAYKLPYTPDYTYIETEDAARKALTYLDRHPMLGLDTETDGLDPITNKVILIQLGTAHKAFLFDMRKLGIDLLEPLLTSDKHLKLLQHAKFDYQMLKYNFGVQVKNIYDTMIAEQLIHLGLYHKAGLAHLVRKYLGFDIEKGLAKSFIDRYDAELTNHQLQYAANDALVLFPIYTQQQEEIKKHGLEIACDVEFGCIPAVGEMELNGIKLASDKWLELAKTFLKKRDVVRAAISADLARTVPQDTLFGLPSVNLGSPAQLKIALKKLGFDLEDTKDATLRRYKGAEVIDKLLKFRKYEKTVTTYGPTFLENIHPVTGRIHSDFRQLVRTGRFSCSVTRGAGLQQIKTDSEFRDCFIAEDGYDMITSDYSQMELRILAEYSKDPNWLYAFEHDIDLHSATAAAVFDVPVEDVKTKYKDLRNKAKAINFGLAYGMSEYGLAARLGITTKAAAAMIQKYFEACPGVKRFLDESGEFAVRNHFIRTISGRKRFFNMPSMDDPEFENIKRSISRMGKNTPIQGSNADVIKRALKYVQNSIDSTGLDAKIVHCVHDEIVVESKKEVTQDVVPMIEKGLCDAYTDFFKKVPIKVDTAIKPHWSK